MLPYAAPMLPSALLRHSAVPWSMFCGSSDSLRTGDQPKVESLGSALWLASSWHCRPAAQQTLDHSLSVRDNPICGDRAGARGGQITRDSCGRDCYQHREGA